MLATRRFRNDTKSILVLVSALLPLMVGLLFDPRRD